MRRWTLDYLVGLGSDDWVDSSLLREVRLTEAKLLGASDAITAGKEGLEDLRE